VYNDSLSKTIGERHTTPTPIATEATGQDFASSVERSIMNQRHIDITDQGREVYSPQSPSNPSSQPGSRRTIQVNQGRPTAIHQPQIARPTTTPNGTITGLSGTHMDRRGIQQASGQQFSTFKKFELTQEGIKLPSKNRDFVGFDGLKQPGS